MAREEQDREDLMRQATALVERAELAADAFAENVFIGFRRDGCASIYFGPEWVVHFNTRSELRRAYRGGKLLKAEHGRLSSLDRRRTESAVQLLRHDLRDAEAAEFLAQTRSDLDTLLNTLSQGAYRLIAQVPVDGNVIPRFERWLSQLSETIKIADSPHAK